MLTFSVAHGVIKIYKGQKLVTSGRVWDRLHAKQIERKFNRWAAMGWPPKDDERL